MFGPYRRTLGAEFSVRQFGGPVRLALGSLGVARRVKSAASSTWLSATPLYFDYFSSVSFLKKGFNKSRNFANAAGKRSHAKPDRLLSSLLARASHELTEKCL